MEHSESEGMRNLVWEYPVSLGSLINDRPGVGRKEKKKERKKKASLLLGWVGQSTRGNLK